MSKCEWCRAETSQDEFCSEICAEQARTEDALNGYPLPPTLPDVDLRGMGGKESELAKLFPNLERESGPLHDFVDRQTGQRYEMKKTGNPRLHAWIDPTKYINLSDSDRNIIFRFVRFDKVTGRCLEYVDTTLGAVVDRFVPEVVLEYAAKIAELYPHRSDFQFKLGIKWRNSM